ncbi:MAG: YwiC-like family protein [Ignavibacteria bacterium]|nr:YwiC-like family protein [Ignavibacteria bacterium]
MIFVPILTAILTVGEFTLSALQFLIISLFCFLAYRPMELVLDELFTRKPRSLDKLNHAFTWFGIYISCAAFPGLELIIRTKLYGLLLFIPTAGVLFFVAEYIRIKYRLALLRDIIAIFGITILCPAMLYLLTGKINLTLGVMWLYNSTFFISSAFFIHMKMFSANSANNKKLGKFFTYRKYNFIYQFILLLSLSIAVIFGYTRMEHLIAFLPIILHSIGNARQESRPVNFKRIGIIFVFYSLFFALFISR